MEDTVDIKTYNNPTDRNQQQILNDSEALFIFETSSENVKNDLQMFHPRLQSDLPHGEHYEIGHINLGIALIFNHKNIADESTRRGTEKDRDRLKAALNKYGFDVRVFDDLSYSEIMKTLQYIANVEDHSSSDCLMVTVMSHGLAGKIYAADQLYEVKELWQPFMGDRCRSLIGKPKMFFIQACRGEKFDDGVSQIRADTTQEGRDDTDAGPTMNLVQTIPTTADLLVMYSTYEGSYSWRNPFYGSWFIQCLAEEFELAGLNIYDKELLSLLTAVARKVAFQYESNVPNELMDRKKQMPTFVSTLTKMFYIRKREKLI